jgi:hypothetical protein
MSFEVRVQPVRRQYLFQLEKDSEGSWFNHGLGNTILVKLKLWELDSI